MSTTCFLVDVGGMNGDDSVIVISGSICVFPGVVGSMPGVREPSISRLSVSYGEGYSANDGSFPPVCGARGVLCACAREGESRAEVFSRSSACEEDGLGGVAVAPVTVSSASSSYRWDSWAVSCTVDSSGAS